MRVSRINSSGRSPRAYRERDGLKFVKLRRRRVHKLGDAIRLMLLRMEKRLFPCLGPPTAAQITHEAIDTLI